MSTSPENSLASAASPYLCAARHQPVQWLEWGPEAFSRAQAENKPILLDIGASWAHWCRVMAQESYESEGTAALINELFIPIKVDRDERPDVDVRYQSAVAAISGQGGWPLTAFLTPDGRPFFGGGYFPPEDRYGRPSLERVCVMMHEAFTKRPEEAYETAESVLASVEGNERFADAREPLTPELFTRLITASFTPFDARNGGFGHQPKFSNSPAIDLMLEVGWSQEHGAGKAAEIALVTLTKMARGGIHDHLAGGFHRYSTDERWAVPHFEKMLYDNAALLGNYARAYAVFGDPLFAATARGILRFFTEVLSDQTLGGFYSSQAADVSLDSNGDFYTWTRAEAQVILTPEEFAVAVQHFNLRAVGDMRHDPARNVLHIGADPVTIARNLKLPEAEVHTLIAHASHKLYAARRQRPMPAIDRTLYTGWNGMAISASLAAAAALNDPAPRDFALKSLDRLLTSAWSETAGLAHVIAYPAGIMGAPGPDYRTRASEPDLSPDHQRLIPATLEDYAFTAAALLDAHQATGDEKYLTLAQNLADRLLNRMYDPIGGAFFDIEHHPQALGILSARRKPLQDSPTPSGNSAAASVLLRLRGEKYTAAALRTLETFAGVVEHFGLYAASYGLALRAALGKSVEKVVKG